MIVGGAITQYLRVLQAVSCKGRYKQKMVENKKRENYRFLKPFKILPINFSLGRSESCIRLA